MVHDVPVSRRLRDVRGTGPGGGSGSGPGGPTALSVLSLFLAAGLPACTAWPTGYARLPLAPSAAASAALAPCDDVPLRLARANEERTECTGWRVGAALVTGKPADTLESYDAGPWLNMWGYQFEIQAGKFLEANRLVTIVPMIMGLEESMVIPTVNVLVGLRMASGLEFGAGPHFSPRMQTQDDGMHVWGLGLAASVGYAFRAGADGRTTIPFNIGAILAKDGQTYFLTVGWHMPRD